MIERGNLSYMELDQHIGEVIKEFDSPLEFPVSFDGFKLGTFKIFFEYTKEKISKEKRNRKYCLLTTLLYYFKDSLPPLLRKIIDIQIKLEEKYDEQIEKAVASEGTFTSIFFHNVYAPRAPISTLAAFLYKKEDEIFELIKAEGPIILCDIDIQEKILEWLADRDIASVRMNKLKESLLEYALKSPPKDTLLKTGRPKADLVEKVGKENILEFYRWLVRFLKFIKKEKEYYCGTDNIYELFKKAGERFFPNITEELKKEKKDIKFLESIEWKRSGVEPFYPISVCLEENEKLEAEFFRFDWEPNKLAKKIIAKLLDVSVSKIEKILYS